MGAESTKRKEAWLEYDQLVKNYHRRLFLKHKKSPQEFTVLLNTIKTRSSYLNYQWATQLIEALNEGNLYQEYTSVLKENCRREGRSYKPFCPESVRSQFMASFCNKYGAEANLEEALQESKCFIMVNKWLSQLVKVSRATDKENPPSSNQFDSKENEKIYTILNSMLLKEYKGYDLAGEDIQITDKIVQKYILMLKDSMKFSEKQMLVKLILDRLAQMSSPNEQDSFEKNLVSVIKAVGVRRSCALIRLIREVGQIQIEKSWKVIEKTMHKKQ